MADVAEKVQGAGGVGERVLTWKRAALRGMTRAMPVPAGIEATT